MLYEADDISPRTRTGWGATVTGLARLVEDSAQAARYKTMVLPWVAVSSRTRLVRGREAWTFRQFRQAPAGRSRLGSSAP